MTKDLTITIKAPWEWECKGCGHKGGHGNRFSYPCECPECGEEKVQHRYMREPKPYVYRNEGSYNWANPSEKQYSYRFQMPEDFKGKTQFIIGIENDLETDSPYDLALEIREALGTWSSHKQEIDRIITYLEENEERFDKDRAEYNFEFTKRELFYAAKNVDFQ